VAETPKRFRPTERRPAKLRPGHQVAFKEHLPCLRSFSGDVIALADSNLALCQALRAIAALAHQLRVIEIALRGFSITPSLTHPARHTHSRPRCESLDGVIENPAQCNFDLREADVQGRRWPGVLDKGPGRIGQGDTSPLKDPKTGKVLL